MTRYSSHVPPPLWKQMHAWDVGIVAGVGGCILWVFFVKTLAAHDASRAEERSLVSVLIFQ